VMVHRGGIADRHDQRRRLALRRADRTKHIGRGEAEIFWRHRPAAGLPPYPGQAVLLANASLVLKPYLDSRTGRLHKDRYVVGEKIGVWPIFSLSENEVIAGRNNKHMDFRLSVMKVPDGDRPRVVVSTISGAPHGLPITHQQQLNADLLAFIKS
jgi:hypothetical protein